MRNVLGRMNGWQRLWFVLTCISFIAFAVIYPFELVNQIDLPSENYKARLAKDLETPQCSDYVSKPIEEIIEPIREYINQSGGDCATLYSARTAQHPDIYPYSMAIYERKLSSFKERAILIWLHDFWIFDLAYISFGLFSRVYGCLDTSWL